MGIIGYINVVLETYGALFSLLVVAFVTVGATEPDQPRTSLVRLFACNAAVLFCDAASWLFEGRTDPLGRAAMELSTLGMFILSYVRLALFTDFIAASIAARGRKPKEGLVGFMWAACGLAATLAAVSLFNGMFYRIDNHGMYVRGDWIGLSQWFGVLCILINGWFLVRHRTAFTPRELLVLGLCVALPAVSLVVQQAFYGLSLLNLSTTLVAVLLYLGVQTERERAIREQELSLERCRTHLAMSQIQPRFLFRALDAIHGLCASEPPAAKKALEELATYLRASTDALASTSPLPLSRELEHVRAYLSLERRCVGDRLSVECAVEASGFAVPALSLQFLVEQAVQRRCLEPSARCAVRIGAWDEGTSWRASVRASGPACPPDQGQGRPASPADDPSAFALEGMRTRVALLQGGKLEARETPEETELSIVVPKAQAAADEDGRR